MSSCFGDLSIRRVFVECLNKTQRLKSSGPGGRIDRKWLVCQEHKDDCLCRIDADSFQETKDYIQFACCIGAEICTGNS